MDGPLSGDGDESPQDSKSWRWEVGGTEKKLTLRREKGTLRNTLISLRSELQWKTARNRSFFVAMTVKTPRDKRNGMLICLLSLLLQLQIFFDNSDIHTLLELHFYK